MFGFGRKRRRNEGTASTFVEATGGGWGDSPSALPGDGGDQADYVDQVLRRANDHALEHNVDVGESFTYTLTDIPRGISGPHEIIFGLMMKADKYGLSVNYAHDEMIEFTRSK